MPFSNLTETPAASPASQTRGASTPAPFVVMVIDDQATAREILWLVTGAEKADMRARLERGDRTIPAGRVAAEHARLLVDEAAARR